MNRINDTAGRRVLAAAVATALLLAGCGAERPAADAAASPSPAASPAEALAANIGSARREQAVGARAHGAPAGQEMPATALGSTVARLPDVGELARIVPDADPVGEGAYRWHRVEMSEEHALASLATGDMVLRTPAGEELTLEYERHEEHSSGDWSWIGVVRDAPPGLDSAVITFGAQAVFGRVPLPGDQPPLVLAMRDGAVWMGETSFDELAKWQVPTARHGLDIPDAAARILDLIEAQRRPEAADDRTKVVQHFGERSLRDLLETTAICFNA